MRPRRDQDGTKPRLDFVRWRTDEAIDVAGLTAGDEREAEHFRDADLSGRDLAYTTFTHCEFLSVDLSEARLHDARFRHTLFTDTFASALSAPSSTWHDVRVENPRWGVAEIFDSDLQSVHVLGGKIDYLNLRNCSATDVQLEDCSIGELDLGKLRGCRIALLGCHIQMLRMSHATCVNVDLRDSEFLGIAGLDGLKGVTITQDQLTLLAPLLATHLGVIVQ